MENSNKTFTIHFLESYSYITFFSSEIMNDDNKFLEFLTHFLKFGFVLIENAPIEEGPTKDLVKRIAFDKVTHYG